MKWINVMLVCLLFGFSLQPIDGKNIHVSSVKCCYIFASKKIYKPKILCYRNTSSTCSYNNAVIFKMKFGREICALKTETWVNDYLSQIKYCS
ncbi:C-C motif chemokine 1 [Suncus etruscus]|uniref:C-C motif chemokine 1 n=1 Tax=Suncus etruscus TaxID=109475 RepID=UPI00210F3A81|nr:C-C motif chemokine 1 [Suncus etruscus]